MKLKTLFSLQLSHVHSNVETRAAVAEEDKALGLQLSHVHSNVETPDDTLTRTQVLPGFN